jgi:hypothetical protein
LKDAVEVMYYAGESRVARLPEKFLPRALVKRVLVTEGL